MMKAFRMGEAYSFFVRPTMDRVWGKLIQKSRTYRRLVTERNLPYVLAVYPGVGVVLKGTFQSEYLYGQDGIFQSTSYLSGLYVFEGAAGRYIFRYFENHEAKRSFALPSRFMENP